MWKITFNCRKLVMLKMHNQIFATKKNIKDFHCIQHCPSADVHKQSQSINHSRDRAVSCFHLCLLRSWHPDAATQNVFTIISVLSVSLCASPKLPMTPCVRVARNKVRATELVNSQYRLLH